MPISSRLQSFTIEGPESTRVFKASIDKVEMSFLLLHMSRSSTLYKFVRFGILGSTFDGRGTTMISPSSRDKASIDCKYVSSDVMSCSDKLAAASCRILIVSTSPCAITC